MAIYDFMASWRSLIGKTQNRGRENQPVNPAIRSIGMDAGGQLLRGSVNEIAPWADTHCIARVLTTALAQKQIGSFYDVYCRSKFFITLFDPPF